MDKIEQIREDILGGKLNRRTVLKRAAVLGLSAPVIAGLLAACGGDDNNATNTTTSSSAPTTASGGTTSPTTSSEAAASATTGGTTASPATGGGTTASPSTGGFTSEPGHGRGKADLLRILYWQGPTILNPHFAQGTKDSAASSLVLEPLIDVLTDGTLIPVLVEEIPSLENGGVAKDGKSVTYKLKKDVVWSDGEPFTSADVEFTWKYVSDKTAATTTIATYQIIDTIEIVDDHTVTLKFKDTTPGWYQPFTTAFGGEVMPKHLLENFMGDKARAADFNLKPIGTGPYKVVEFKPGDVITYEINDTYREADKPYFSKIEFKGGGDATAAARAALQTGETDWGWNLQVEKAILEPMAEGGVGVLLSNPGLGVERILVNFADPNKEVDGAKSEPSTQHPFLTDKAVRQAFALGCDRDTIAEQLYGPSGKPTSNVLVGPEKFASKTSIAEFDVDKAMASLESAGWTGSPRAKDGVEMKVLYQTTINTLRQKTQEIVKQAWEQMGVPTELKSIDASVFFSSDAGNPDTANHFYADFEMFTNNPSVPYPISYMAVWKSVDPAVDLSQKSNQWAGVNTERWVNEDYNKLYTQATTELDEQKQVELFTGMNDLVVSEVVEIPLVHRADVVAASKKLKGYKPSPWTTDVRDIANWYFEE